MGIISEQIEEIFNTVEAGNAGTTDPWGGAGVIVANFGEPESRRDRMLYTNYPGEVSWLIAQLTEAMRKIEDFGVWKFEYYGRLANRTIPLGNAPQNEQLLALIHETLLVLTDLHSEQKLFIVTLVVGNEIADDVDGSAKGRAEISVIQVRAEIGEMLKSLP